MNQEPGPRNTQSACRIAATDSGQACGRRRVEGHRDDVAGGGRHLDLAAHRRRPGRLGGVQAADLGGDVHRGDRHRQHPPLGAQQPAHPVEGPHVVAHELPEPDDEEVAQRVALHVALPREAVLEDVGPRAAPVVVAAERGERHPQVTRRQHAELPRSRPEEPPLSATVTTAVSVDGEVGLAAPERAEGREEAVPAARGRRRPGRCSRASPSLPPEVAVRARRCRSPARAAARRSPRSSRRCGACRRCSRSPPS